MSKKDTKKVGDNLNKNKLESKMKLFGDTGTSLSKYLGMARSTFSSKINETNGAEFNQGKIAMIRKRYEFTPLEVVEIFFDSEVSKLDTKIN